MSAQTAQIQVRIDPHTKKQAQKILETLGLDVSVAVKMLMKQIVLLGKLPLANITVNGFTAEEEHQMIQETKIALQSNKKYDSIKELHKEIISDQ